MNSRQRFGVCVLANEFAPTFGVCLLINKFPRRFGIRVCWRINSPLRCLPLHGGVGATLVALVIFLLKRLKLFFQLPLTYLERKLEVKYY